MRLAVVKRRFVFEIETQNVFTTGKLLFVYELVSVLVRSLKTLTVKNSLKKNVRKRYRLLPVY